MRLKNCLFFNSILKAAVLTGSLFAVALAQNNPIPQIVGPVHPDAVAPGSGAFTLSVYGANFVPGSIVDWNYHPRVTTYISGHEIQAQILASDVETNTAGYITVTNPAPGGGSSSASWAQVEVHEPITTITLDLPQYHDFGIWQLEAADFTHNATLDLIGEVNSAIGFMQGTGTGTFIPKAPVDPYYLAPFQIGYGDFNNDGNLDVVVPTSFDSYEDYPNYVDVRLGNGAGVFAPASRLKLYEQDAAAILVGDFNRDGNLDLITGDENVSLYRGRGDGTFASTINYPFGGKDIETQMLTGDFNVDGILDLLFLGNGTACCGNGGRGLGFWFLAGTGDGGFKAPKKVGDFPVPEMPAVVCTGGGADGAPSMKVSDFNGDGKLDLAFCNGAQIGVMLGNGDGTFQPPNYYTGDPTGNGQFSFAIGDINSDGKADLIVSEFGTTSEFVVFLGNGDGTFQVPETLFSGGHDGELGVVTGDFNADGLLDVIFSDGLGMDVFLQSQ